MRRARAARIGNADFLHARAAGEIKQRLVEVNRTFHAPVIVGSRPDIWQAQTGLEASCVPDTEVLDAAPDSADLVIHGLCLHHVNDPVGQLVQARRALRPDGLFVAALFGGETLFELRDALTLAETQIRGGLSPRVAPMGDIRSLGALLQRAGLALPVADSDRVTVTYAHPPALMHDLRAMGETNILAGQDRSFLRRDMLVRASEIYCDKYSDAAGRIRATFEIVYLTGWAPADSQQQPLRPGSARSRLADALGTSEFGAGEKAG